jgi:5'-nucleotidase
MRILVSNDDGCRAPGLLALRDAVSGHCEQAVIVAPERDRSGASNSLTLDRPLRVTEIDSHRYCVNGTPTDCVHLALCGLFEQDPHLVVSGINAGANLGDDVLYSGTVAAAMEGRFLGLPAIAFSLAGSRLDHYDTAARVAGQLVEMLKRDPLPPNTIINVNVPDVPYASLRGFELTRLGNRHRSEPLVEAFDPRGRTVYWIGPPGAEADAGPGTDFHAVRERRVSITPISTDLTRHAAVEKLTGWVGRL